MGKLFVQDVDECQTGRASCFGGRRCVNTIGSYRCACAEGFVADPSTGRCKDVDECEDARYARIIPTNMEVENNSILFLQEKPLWNRL